jgi:hypothetical protein
VALLVSHAQQIIREAEGYGVTPHRMHVPPKSSPDESPLERLLEASRKEEIVAIREITRIRVGWHRDQNWSEQSRIGNKQRERSEQGTCHPTRILVKDNTASTAAKGTGKVSEHLLR